MSGTGSCDEQAEWTEPQPSEEDSCTHWTLIKRSAHELQWGWCSSSQANAATLLPTHWFPFLRRVLTSCSNVYPSLFLWFYMVTSGMSNPNIVQQTKGNLLIPVILLWFHWTGNLGVFFFNLLSIIFYPTTVNIMSQETKVHAPKKYLKNFLIA